MTAETDVGLRKKPLPTTVVDGRLKYIYVSGFPGCTHPASLGDLLAHLKVTFVDFLTVFVTFT